MYSCFLLSLRRISQLFNSQIFLSFSFFIFCKAYTLLSVFSISCSSCYDLFFIDSSYSNRRYFYYLYKREILSLRRDLVYYNFDIYLFCLYIFYWAYLTFFCFSFKLRIQLFIFFGYLSSNAFKFRSIIFLIPLSPLSESLLPLRAKLIKLQLFWSISIYIFQYFSETQLSEALKYLNSTKLLIFQTKCMNPLSDILHPEKSNFYIICPAGDYFKLSTSSINPQSPSKFLLKFKVRSLPQFMIVMSDLIPSLVIQFEERLSTFRFSMFLSMKLKIFSINPKPLSPIPLPLRFISYSREFTAPSKNVQTPSPNNSLYSRFIFLIFLLFQTYFRRVGPMEDLMKFLPKSRDTKLIPLMRIYSAPSVLIRFYEILSYFSCLFFFKGIEMISAPFIPISLSYNFSTSRALFCNKTAAKHLAPSIPNEFLRIEPSSIPKFNDLR